MRRVDGDPAHHQALALRRAVHHHVGAETGTDSAHDLGPAQLEVGHQQLRPVPLHPALPGGHRLGPLLPPEEVRDDAGDAQHVGHEGAVLAGATGLRPVNVVAPQQPALVFHRSVPVVSCQSDSDCFFLAFHL